MSRIYATALAALILSVGSFWAGWEWRDRSADVAVAERDRDDAKAETQVVADARTNDHASSANVAKVEEAAAEKSAEREVVFQVIEKEVVRYVEKQDRARCVTGLDADGLRIWRAANAGQSPEAGPGRIGGLPATLPAVPATR